MVSSSSHIGWAKSLVGRDWEIFWNEEEDNDKTGTSDGPAESVMDQDVEVGSKKENAEPEDSDDDSNTSEGSVIDDWYAGHVVSLQEDCKDGKFVFKVRFVGEEEIYDMVLEPTKVRPSARGWIKRTKALLCSSGQDDDQELLPPDTSMINDQLSLNNLRTEIESYPHLSFSPPEHKGGVQSPRLADMKKILHFRYLLQAQILLRSRLSTIVNHHGSTQFVDGEPNPTESYVEHLAQCCQEMDLVCGWYLRCWELLVRLFGEPGHQQSSSSVSDLTIEKMFHEYLEYGKISLVKCATMDVAPTASKRRLLFSETSALRRPKRRRKLTRWSNGSSSDGIDIVADECDLRSTTSVDLFVKTLSKSTERWFHGIFANMLQVISHFVVDPVIRWQRQSKRLIGEASSGLLKELVFDDGLDAASNTSSADGEDDEVQQSPDEEPEADFFSLEEVESCFILTQTNRVLATLDLGGDDDKLRKKISDISASASIAADLLKCLASRDSAKSKEEDRIIAGLKSILEATRSPGNSLFNVDPIGKSDSPLTRAFLSRALDLRTWLLDVWHAQRVRERCTFIENLASRITSLPDFSVDGRGIFDLVALSNATKDAKLETQKLVDELASHRDVIAKYNNDLQLGREGHALMSHDGAKKAMIELSKCSALSVVEEKLAVRSDLLGWSALAASVFDDEKRVLLEFVHLERLHALLHSIVTGRSQSRVGLIADLETNPAIDRELCSFALADSVVVCGRAVDKLTRIHSRAVDWKERSDAITQALRAHGNAAAGETTHPTKLPAMVDIKRIADLLKEYNSVRVDQDGVKEVLAKICREADAWSSSLLSTITDEKYPLDNCLSFLENQRDCRPRGIIMDPTRMVFDCVLDLLIWQNRVKEAIVGLSEESNTDEIASSIQAEDMSSILVNTMYPLLAEGIEVLEGYAGIAVAEEISPIKPDTQNCLKVLENLYGVRRSARAISKTRLESHPVGSALLSRLLNTSADIDQGCPLRAMLWTQWHICVAELVNASGDNSDEEEDNNIDNTHSSSVCRSLAEARELVAQQPNLSIGTNTPPGLICLASAKSSELVRLECLIRRAENKEAEIRHLLHKSKEMLKGSIHQTDSVRKHLVQLKEAHILLKDLMLGEGGLSLDPAIETQVEHNIKVLTWLVRTFAFPLLHLDEATFSSSNENVDVDHRIPFDVLISLYDRMPCEVDKQAGDFALVSLRVRELYEAAKKWQDEITRNTTISFRGGKRRAVGFPGASEQDQEASSKLQMEQMKKLAENPVLTKVAMPRESAVNGILESSSQFEIELQHFLGKDYGGYSPDRAPYPGKDSLVGENGEFVLYRLTGSPLFGALQSSLHSLSSVGCGVLAETPGKATFDWIMAAVEWIEQLLAAITTDSPFETVKGNVLVVPARDAREILKSGETIFLNIPEDLKRTLSKHGIFVTTNRQDKTIRVSLKKDGAHHSVGGTVIRWCPILFECLKADISRLDDWERALTEILSDFNAFFSETREHPKTDEKNLYHWYCYRERVHELLHEGQESLVISPQKGLVLSFQNLLASINNYLKKHCKGELEKKFAKKWFAQSSSLVDDRFLLLESLLYRTAASDDRKAAAASSSTRAVEPERCFRDACRSYIEKSLSRAAKLAGLGELESNDDEDMKSYCTIIAWDVEREMFERFQGEFGFSRVSEEYRDKARSLRCNLEDKNNLSLCLRILTGDLDAAKLVDMSSQELASQKAKSKRARAEKEAKYHANLTPQFREDPSERTIRVDSDKKEAPGETLPGFPKPADVDSNSTPEKKSERAALKSVLRVSKHVARLPVDEGAHAESKAAIISNETSASTSSATPATRSESDLDDSSSPAALRALMKASKKARPPPPPSLATSFQTSSNSPPLTSNRGIRVLSLGGSDSFRIEIGNPRSAFHSAFYLEDEWMFGGNSFLAETLAERGRLRSEEFSRFLRDKLSGGRWQAVPLRLVTFSEEDAREYKKFYKEYEVRNRIAMFYVGQNSKLFLVTPKFHDAARIAGLDGLQNRTSTYAVVLTKETMFCDA